MKSRTLRAFVALVIAVTLAQVVSLAARAGRGETDFGVFYRTCRLLAAGMGGEIYTRLDAVTTWPISLSPTGLAVFQPLAWLTPTMAGAAWGLFNLALLGVSVVALRDVLRDRDAGHANRVYLAAALLFLILSTASIQVGQFSVLFVACWILAFQSLLQGRFFWTAFLLAIPSAIKLYPLLMVAVPLSLARDIRIGIRHVALLTLSLLVMALLVPAAMYGGRAWTLNLSFWQNVILNPSGQVQYMQFPRFGNQSVDSILLRYFTHEPDFHDVFVNLPHLALDKSRVVAVANAVRVAVLGTTIATVWLWRRRLARAPGPADLVAMAALWSATLYLLLPETKARYAVYALFAFVPLLQQATDHGPQSTSSDRRRRWVEIVACAALLLLFLPVSIQAVGVGLLGPALLWVENLKAVRRAASPRG